MTELRDPQMEELDAMFRRRERDPLASLRLPEDARRRVRRRQVGTTAAAALLSVALIAVTVAGVDALRGTAPSELPAGVGNDLPPRTARIQGLAVTAPTGWTLQDLSPWAQVTEQTSCFASVGGSADTSNTASPTQDCSTAPAPHPAGIPIYQLSNFDPGLSSTVCGLLDQPPVDLPSDGAAMYVARFTPGSSADLSGTCPGYIDSRVSERAGFVGAPFYVGVVVAGKDATTDSVQLLRDQLATFGQSEVQPTVPTAPGPGYILDAGQDGDTSWRLEAGLSLTCQSLGRCAAQFALVTAGPDGAEQTESAALPTQGEPLVAAMQTVGGTTLVWGTADVSVTDVMVVQEGGATLAPSTTAWPGGVNDTVNGQVPELTGSLWWAIVDGPVQVRATLADGSTYTTRPGQASGTPVPGEVPPPPGIPVTSGRAADGTAWALSVGVDPDPVLYLGVAGDLSATTYGWVGRPPLTEPGIFAGWGPETPIVVTGTVPDDVASIRMVSVERTIRLDASALYPLPPEFGPVLGFVGTLPTPASGKPRYDITVRFYDASGSEVYQPVRL